MVNSFPHIVSDPDILGGKPCIAGTRISVELVLEWLGTGGTPESIAGKHPLLTPEMVREALLYASTTSIPHLS
ncbi:MAG: DUF433 domain-containing protein [Saprospiraceae bacterium]|nr:DUF433 domain-containing protein [Saprospiraceae bacterium]HNE29810.1 DUF433 domain-containing protein [Saprospiraceae bacterium]